VREAQKQSNDRKSKAVDTCKRLVSFNLDEIKAFSSTFRGNVSLPTSWSKFSRARHQQVARRMADFSADVGPQR
jgi:hypothetical protein